jgi:hypothetical protein
MRSLEPSSEGPISVDLMHHPEILGPRHEGGILAEYHSMRHKANLESVYTYEGAEVFFNGEPSGRSSRTAGAGAKPTSPWSRVILRGMSGS